MALTDKKLAFVEAIREGLNQTEAAIKAGYSEHTAQVQGSRLMNDPDIMRALSGDYGDDEVSIPATDDPLEFLQAVWNAEGLEVKDRIAAARAALPYKHQRLGETGKKDAAKEDAKNISQSGGKFATRAARKENYS